jgi:hypothetical protein
MGADDPRRPADDALVAELRDVLDQVDPLPPVVVQAGKAVLGWRRLDADLAELLADSALEAEVGARAGRALARDVRFASDDLEVDVAIHYENARLRLVGQLAPPAAATIEIQTDDGTVVGAAEADPLGRFRVELDMVPRARLRIARPGTPEPPVVVTSWLSF